MAQMPCAISESLLAPVNDSTIVRPPDKYTYNHFNEGEGMTQQQRPSEELPPIPVSFSESLLSYRSIWRLKGTSR